LIALLGECGELFVQLGERASRFSYDALRSAFLLCDTRGQAVERTVRIRDVRSEGFCSFHTGAADARRSLLDK